MSKRMPKPDRALKEFFADNETFADLFNAVLFEGEQVIRPEDLQEQNTELTLTTKETKGFGGISRYRDVARKTALGCTFVILGVENQQKIHYGMPVRKMLYDSLEYVQQCKEKVISNKDNKGYTADEYLSKLKKGTRLSPCFTIVFYVGEKTWDGPRTLHDMLDLDDRIAPFIDNGSINLVEVKNGTQSYKLHNERLISFFNMLHDVYGRIPSQTKYKGEIAQLIGIVVSSKKIYDMGLEQEEIVMCNALKELEQKGIEQGIEIGIERGIERGIEQGIERGMERAYLRIAYKLWKKGYSVEQCMEFVDVKEEALVKMYQLFSQYPEVDIQELEKLL